MEDDDGDPRRTGNVAANATVNARWATGARVGKGGMRDVVVVGVTG